VAYIPDDAMRRKRTLTGSAWDVYEALCAFADPDTGIVEARHWSHERLVEQTGGLALGTVKNAMTELRIGRRDTQGQKVHEGGWVEERGGCLHLLVGTFLNELRQVKKQPLALSPVGDEKSPVGDACASLPSPTGDKKSPASDDSSPTGDARGNNTELHNKIRWLMRSATSDSSSAP
jgi:hypothetical protein